MQRDSLSEIRRSCNHPCRELSEDYFMTECCHYSIIIMTLCKNLFTISYALNDEHNDSQSLHLTWAFLRFSDKWKQAGGEGGAHPSFRR